MIAVLIPMVWGMRNAVYSGVLARLAARGVAARLFLKELPAPASRWPAPELPASAEYDRLLAPEGRAATGKALLDSVVCSAFNRRHRIASYDIYRHWFHRNDGLRERIRSAGVEVLGALGTAPPVFDALCRRAEQMYLRTHSLAEVREQLERCRPDLLWSTVCVSPWEYPYILAAREMGVPVVTSILSFDNLTSRGRLPHFDHYLVWNERMREQLRRFYPYVGEHRVTVTGTPQFDFHRRAEFRWTRERTLQRLGIPRGARYLLYSTSHEVLAPDEPALVKEVAARLRTRKTLEDHWLVVRLHPLDDGRRWTGLADESSRIRISPAWDDAPDATGWTLSSAEDQARLTSTIFHADVCVNVASTMSLDAAILDRPVVNIDFSMERDSPRGLLYAEYGADHYRPLVESGGVRLAHGWDELVLLLERAVVDPALDGSERQAMVRRECGVVDGASASRVADALLGLLDQSAAERSRPIGDPSLSRPGRRALTFASDRGAT